MNTYLVLLRGINVGGKNKVSMAELRTCLEGLGFSAVSTFIVSGNVFLTSDRPAGEVTARIEEALPKAFQLDSELIKVLVLTRDQLQAVVDGRPEGFGDQPEKYHSDAIFLMGGVDARALVEHARPCGPRTPVNPTFAGVVAPWIRPRPSPTLGA